MAKKSKVIIVAILGTLLEYYDYALYGFLAIFLAEHFFPAQAADSNLPLIQTWMIFATASLAKPLGALLFGHLGDTQGRVKSLRINMWGIALPTALIGILPGYGSMGLWAIAALLLCRILQGMSLGGEYDGVTIYVLEHVGKKHPGFANSLVCLASSLGICLAAFAASLVSQSHAPHIYWRLPFILGGLFGLGVLWSRRYLEETPEFSAYQKQRPQKMDDSFRVFFKTQWRSLGWVALLCGAVGGSYHFYFVFLNTYLHSILKILPMDVAARHLFVSLLIYTLFGPLAGWLSDKLGAQKTLLYALATLTLLIGIHVVCLSNHFLPPSLLYVTALVFTFFHIPGNVFLLQHMPVDIRYRCLSLGHALGSAVLSGSTPVLCLFIWQNSQQTALPFLYLIMLLLLAFLAIWGLSKKLKCTCSISD